MFLFPLQIFTLYKSINTFNDPYEDGFGKHCGKKRKMLVIFSFSHSVFYSIKERNSHFSIVLTLSQTTYFKLKKFADNNFEFDENGRKFSKRVEKCEKRRVTCNFSFSHSVFKRLVLQTP